MLDQSTVSNIVEDFTIQPGKPTSPATFRDWLAGEGGIVVAAGIMALLMVNFYQCALVWVNVAH